MVDVLRSQTATVSVIEPWQVLCLVGTVGLCIVILVAIDLLRRD